MKRAVASLVIAWQTVLGGAAQPAGDGSAELAARVQAFARQVRCLVCQNETLADSQADLAGDLRREIREQMTAGRTDDEISAYLTQRYGDFVLYRPPLQPRTYVLWFGPFGLLAVGFFTLGRHLKRRPRSQATARVSPAQQRRARRLLDGASSRKAVG